MTNYEKHDNFFRKYELRTIIFWIKNIFKRFIAYKYAYKEFHSKGNLWFSFILKTEKFQPEINYRKIQLIQVQV